MARYFWRAFVLLAVALSFQTLHGLSPQGSQLSPANLETLNGCGMEGDAKKPAMKALNRLKNRYTARNQCRFAPLNGTSFDFKSGKLENLKAEKGGDCSPYPDSKYLLGQFQIGLNPEAKVTPRLPGRHAMGLSEAGTLRISDSQKVLAGM
jgi:hypothetical protein